MAVYEITYVGAFVNDRGQKRNSEMSEAQARKQFGKEEWKEIKAGCLPHIVAMKVS